MQLKWWHYLLIIFYVCDLAVLHYFIFRTKSLSEVTNTVTNNYSDVCGADCQKYIDAKISAIPTSVSQVKTVTNTTVAKKSKIRTVSYLPLSTGPEQERTWNRGEALLATVSPTDL